VLRTVGNQVGQLHARGQRLRARIRGRTVGQFVGRGLAAPLANPAQRLVAGDRVQPRTQSVRITQLRKLGGRDAERILHAVGGGFAVAKHSDAEVVQPVGVAVVDPCERPPVAGGRGSGQISVAADRTVDVPVG
jgi:hypothetical protein